MNIEKEYKVLVNQEQFNKMLCLYPGEKIIQTNHYYDNDSNIMMRFRVINDDIYFTMKVYDKQLYEYEFKVNNIDINHKDIIKLIDQYQIKNIRYIGDMKTTRYLTMFESGELCLDYNEYNDIIDYEIEYELFDYRDDQLDYFISLLNKVDIEYQENNISKFNRFKRRKK